MMNQVVLIYGNRWTLMQRGPALLCFADASIIEVEAVLHACLHQLGGFHSRPPFGVLEWVRMRMRCSSCACLIPSSPCFPFWPAWLVCAPFFFIFSPARFCSGFIWEQKNTDLIWRRNRGFTSKKFFFFCRFLRRRGFRLATFRQAAVDWRSGIRIWIDSTAPDSALDDLAGGTKLVWTWAAAASSSSSATSSLNELLSMALALASGTLALPRY